MFTGKQNAVGIVGLGIIGSRAAENLRDAGYHVYVWSRTPKPIPNFLGSPSEIAQLAKVIQIFVRDHAGLAETIEGLKPQLTPKHIVLNHATVSPEATARAAEAVAETGAAFLDAPFTGSRDAAQKAALVYFVGGDPRVLEKVRPVLEVTGKEIVYVGGTGDATVLKIATNMLVAGTVEVLAEALTLVRHCGIEAGKLGDALSHHAARSGLTDMKLPSMVEGDYTPHFSLQNMFKDLQYALSLANEHGLDLPATSTTAGVLFNAMGKGLENEDFSVVAARFPEPEPAPPATGDPPTEDESE